MAKNGRGKIHKKQEKNKPENGEKIGVKSKKVVGH